MAKQIGSVSNYAKGLFLDSLLTGIPQIFQTQSIARKVLKSFVLLACLVGFVYQTSEFLTIFWSYPTVLDIDVKYPEVIESPSITFCNLNGIKRSKFCPKYPEDCDMPRNLTGFCEVFPKICRPDLLKKYAGKDYFRFPVHAGLHFEKYVTKEELVQMGHASGDILRHCMIINNNTLPYVECSRENIIHTPMNDGHTGYRNCYTILSSINSSTLNRHKLPVPKKKDALFHMAFDLEPNDYFRPDREVGGIIAIHSPNNLINPFFNGFVIKPGNLYSVHLKVVEEKLLPYPYETKCQDYRAMWRARGGRGPLSQETCLAECVYNASMSQCKCVIPDILYPHQDRVCSDEELDCFNFNVSQCYTVCHQPCDFTDFEYEIQERKLENTEVNTLEDMYQNTSNSNHRAAVLIFLKRPEIVIYSHRPQYEDVEVFSFMGGYVGMWLGVSLIAVCDFLESVTLIFNFWIRKKFAKES